ncbi:BMP family ABC transporter substrate-binding protein [Oceanobacillus saliphilus]|uniref:BMP family ABC transporter substrate-binding protein n=1 Tax=Oceanobacillus saliphilus TaxID=2925834 RepID=UPI00201D7996|nr:BMP family ABC transporter substrate-binding protein [Oceanobacillus saliphilus]
MKKIINVLLYTTLIFILSGCSYFETGQIQNAGLLIDTSIDDSAWSKKGYKGLLQIEKELEIEVFYKEEVVTKADINNAVAELVQDGVNLIFGHSNMYGSHFMEIADLYPDVHFVYFNGGNYAENVTSLNFSAHAMGFFAGMVAGEMTTTDSVGIIAAYLWQPEIEGFFEGAKYQNPSAEIEFDYMSNWNDTDTALNIYDSMRQREVDVIYPIGDTFSDAILKKAEEDGIYSIGYISDQLDMAPKTVLTSTIQHVDKLYTYTAEQFNDNNLEGSIMTFDFQEGYISLGEFNDSVPESFQQEMAGHVEKYIETGLLPNER